jgi:hypothetical protein
MEVRRGQFKDPTDISWQYKVSGGAHEMSKKDHALVEG